MWRPYDRLYVFPRLIISAVPINVRALYNTSLLPMAHASKVDSACQQNEVRKRVSKKLARNKETRKVRSHGSRALSIFQHNRSTFGQLLFLGASNVRCYPILVSIYVAHQIIADVKFMSRALRMFTSFRKTFRSCHVLQIRSMCGP